jgi:hypothetical protein
LPWRGSARRGWAGQGWAGQIKAGMAWRGLARRGQARQGRSRQARRGEARPGKARQGRSRQATKNLTKGVFMQYLTKQDAGIVRKRRSEIIEKMIERIVKKSGIVKPETLIEESRISKSAEEKNLFEWDNDEAARKYRLAQATSFILASKFVCFLVESKKQPINVAHANQVQCKVRRYLPFKDQGFKDRREVLDDEESRKAIIERKKSVLRSWCDSVVDIEELLSLRNTILSAI